MANEYDQLGLANALRARFGAGSIEVFGDPTAISVAAKGEAEMIENVVHLSAPASGTQAPHGSPPASIFFFAATSDGDGPRSSTCVSIWWGAESSFEEALLRDLQASSSGQSPLARQQMHDRLAIPRAMMKWQYGTRSKFDQDEIVIDASSDVRSQMLDKLAFSHALQRHMKLQLLEADMERILGSVKRIIRQGRPSLLRRSLPASLGGVDSGARTMQVRCTS